MLLARLSTKFSKRAFVITQYDLNDNSFLYHWVNFKPTVQNVSWMTSKMSLSEFVELDCIDS